MVHVDAGLEAPSDKMCTALDLEARWSDQAGGFNTLDAYEGNHAIVIRNGDVIGLRPSFVTLMTNQTLNEYYHTIDCINSSEITLTLPSSPKHGQHYTIIQQGARINISSSIGICNVRKGRSEATFSSYTLGQVTWVWYNGSQWIVSYTTD